MRKIDKSQRTLFIIAGVIAFILLGLVLLMPLRQRPTAPDQLPGVQTPRATFTSLSTASIVRSAPTAFLPASTTFTTQSTPTQTPKARPAKTQPSSTPAAASAMAASPTAQGPQEFYAAVDGSSTNDGTRERPWSLQYALDQPDALRPGDTLWLRGGTYVGSFTSNIQGAEGKPITVRAYPGERAILANTKLVLDIAKSAYVNFWDLEITATSNDRDPQNRSESGYGVRINQGQPSKFIKFINMIVHDMPAQGFGWWQANTDSEIYGSLIYYNGVTQLDHGVYVHNNTGEKRIVDNLIFDNASHGIHAYGEKDYQGINNLHIEGNTVFDNGSIGYNTKLRSYGIYKRNILVGGDLLVAENPVITNNYTYYPGGTGEALNLGYQAGSKNALVENNYFAGGSVALGGNNDGVQILKNTILGFGLKGLGLGQLRKAGNDLTLFKPRIARIFVRPNQYEPGRANITVYNWSKGDQVTLLAEELKGVQIQAGDKYELHNAQDFFSDIITGTYNGREIEIPMKNHTVAQPLGLDFKPGSTFPEFGAFILIVR